MSNNLFKFSFGKEKLWKGCMVASIAHAIMVAHYPETSNEHSWDGMNYSVQDSEGARGTITFSKKFYVGALRDDNSERIGEEKLFDYNSYFKNTPHNIFKLAQQEALQYLLEDVNENIKPLITTAIWGNETETFSNDSFEDMKNNGGFLIERQTMELEDAFSSWKEYYEMTPQQYDLLRHIYERKMLKPGQILKLTAEEINKIGTNDKEGLYESRVSFSEIGIEWEE